MGMHREHVDKLVSLIQEQYDDMVYAPIQRMLPLFRNWHVARAVCCYDAVCLVLYILRTGTPQATVGTVLGIKSASVDKVVKRTLPLLLRVLQPLYLPMPTSETFKRSYDTFSKLPYNLPGVLGAVDGIVFPVGRYKPYNARQLWNFKHAFPSLNTLALCDALGRFIFVSVGFRGPRGDAGMWNSCALGQSLHNGDPWGPGGLLPNIRVWLPATREWIKPYIIGDAAFALRTHCITPFQGRNLSPEQLAFNTRLSQNRSAIERAFGTLLARFGILRKRLMYTLPMSKAIIFLCSTTSAMTRVFAPFSLARCGVRASRQSMSMGLSLESRREQQAHYRRARSCAIS